MIALILLFLALSALLYSYILYPLILRHLARGKQQNKNIWEDNDPLFPKVAVLMAVHNEQDVLGEKISSILSCKLPVNGLEILVGSDASTDNTAGILRGFAAVNSCVKYKIYEERRGKSAIINELAGLTDAPVLIITDANVIPEYDAIYLMVRHFRNNDIGLVDSNMKHKGLRDSGISIQENAYISGEVKIKYHEGVIWGTMMGPFGGCFAVRRVLYSDVPPLFLVDDFYINMKVLESGHKAIIEKEAFVVEDVSNSLREEFRRKVRIATGNFQNLKHFTGCLFPAIRGLSFCFFSHKVLRWMGPFFLGIIFISTLFLSRHYFTFLYVLYLMIIILAIPLIDYLLGKIGIHVIILRFVTHFISMNFALLTGFINFLKGVKSNVWQPTRRNQ